MDNSLWKRLWTCLKTDYGVKEYFALERDILLDNAGLSKLEVAEFACSQEPAVMSACLIIQRYCRNIDVVQYHLIMKHI
jgi:hypothetical protein